MTDEDEEGLRWLVTIVYRSGHLGAIDIEHHVEELAELQEIVERGPDWNCLERIEIRLNPRRVTSPGDTLEKSLDR